MKKWFKKFENWNYLLFYKWVAVNVFGFALLGHAYILGFVDLVLQNDVSQLSSVIFGLFIVSLFFIGWKIFNVSKEIGSIKNGKNHTGNLKQLELKFAQSSNLVFFRELITIFVWLGLIGTVVGFIIMMSGIPIAGADDAESAKQLIRTMSAGLGAALYTTLVGAVFGIWSKINYIILYRGVTNLIAQILEARENHEPV